VIFFFPYRDNRRAFVVPEAPAELEISSFDRFASESVGVSTMRFSRFYLLPVTCLLIFSAVLTTAILAATVSWLATWWPPEICVISGVFVTLYYGWHLNLGNPRNVIFVRRPIWKVIPMKHRCHQPTTSLIDAARRST
jgi:hypothetical protein